MGTVPERVVQTEAILVVFKNDDLVLNNELSLCFLSSNPIHNDLPSAVGIPKCVEPSCGKTSAYGEHGASLPRRPSTDITLSSFGILLITSQEPLNCSVVCRQERRERDLTARTTIKLAQQYYYTGNSSLVLSDYKSLLWREDRLVHIYQLCHTARMTA